MVGVPWCSEKRGQRFGLSPEAQNLVLGWDEGTEVVPWEHPGLS